MNTPQPNHPVALPLPAALAAKYADLLAADCGVPAELVHELQVHQVELQMQNEALHQAKTALEESNERYLDLYEFAPLGYLTLTRSGRIAEANITAATLLGIERKALQNQCFDRFVGAEDLERWQHKFAAVMARGGLQGFDLALAAADSARTDHRPAGSAAGAQSATYVQVTCLRVEAAQSSMTDYALRMTLIDISEKRQLDLELEHYRNNLESMVQRRTVELAAARDAADAANRAKTVFLTTMSHQLRTPINAVLGLSHALRRDGASAQQAATLDKIDASGRHLIGLVSDNLDLATIDAGVFALEEKDFRLSELLGAVQAMLGDRASAKGLAFAIATSDIPQTLRGDPTRLAQALVNYLSNAVEFTERGSVTLSACLLDEDDDGYLLRFEVSDTGVGLSAEQQTSLFGGVAAADGRRRGGGSGLGLPLTRRIAKLMGGEVGVDSAPGQGSRFWMTARLGKGRADVAAPGPAESAEAVLRREHCGARILLADDDLISQEVMQMLLGDAGLVLDVASDGAEAVFLARQNDYALILMDMQMPTLDGLAATRAIRSLPGREATPILAMTANVFKESQEACLAAGMDACILKPAPPETLFRNISEWLSKR